VHCFTSSSSTPSGKVNISFSSLHSISFWCGGTTCFSFAGLLDFQSLVVIRILARTTTLHCATNLVLAASGAHGQPSASTPVMTCLPSNFLVGRHLPFDWLVFDPDDVGTGCCAVVGAKSSSSLLASPDIFRNESAIRASSAPNCSAALAIVSPFIASIMYFVAVSSS